MFNKEINILKALAIISVVAGHVDIPLLGPLFMPYSYHMALFFFISGYFYKEENENNIPNYIVKKAKSLLIPYFLYNAFFALVTVIIFKHEGVLFGHLPTLKNFFISPFFNGHQYAISCPLWFVPQLFIVQSAFIIFFSSIKKLLRNHLQLLGTFFLLGIGSLFLAKYSNIGIMLILIRTLFAMCFYYLGLYYKQVLESKKLFTLRNLVLVIFLQSGLFLFHKNIDYFLVWGSFKGHFIPIITSITGIWASIFAAKALTPFVKENDFLSKIGQNTYHIMANHLFIFFIITYTNLKLRHIDLSITKGDAYWVYHHDNYAFLYITISLIACVLIGESLKKASAVFKQHLNPKISILKDLNNESEIKA